MAAVGGERIRIVIMIESLDYDPGGAERLVLALATHLPEDRFDVTVCTTQRVSGELVDRLRADGVRHLPLERRTRLDLLAWRRLTRFLREHRVDVLHSHMWGSNFWGSVLGRVCGVPAIVAHEHSWAYKGKPYRRFLDGYVIGRLATVFLTVANRDLMVEWEHVPAQKVRLMPNPYIPRPPVGGDLRAELGVGADAPLVGTAARMRPEKELEVLIDAFAAVARAVPEARLLLAGDGPSRARLERHVASLDLADRVHFLGMREDIDGLLRALDVAAMSSRFEGSPLFAFECMAHEVPLVATAVGGLNDVFEDGRTALLVPAGDREALADAIVALLREPDRRALIAAAAHAQLENYSIERVIGRYVELYEELTGRAQRRRVVSERAVDRLS
jgi:glycosyltransferase involved in cell wall biosynthesis